MRELEAKRTDGRSSWPETLPCITIPNYDLGVSTEYEFNQDQLEVRVEGLEYSIGPLVQAVYQDNTLESILINFNFVHFKDLDESNSLDSGEQRMDLIINYLKTSSPDEIQEFKDAATQIGGYWDLPGIRNAIRKASAVTAEFLAGMYEEEEMEENMSILERSGWIERLAYELWEKETYHSSLTNPFADALGSFYFDIKDHVDEDELEIAGISLSAFSPVNFAWQEVKGISGELSEDRTVSNLGELCHSLYGKIRFDDRIIEVVRINGEKILLQFLKDGRKLLISIPLTIDQQEARKLIEDQTLDPKRIRETVPFEIFELDHPLNQFTDRVE